MAGSGKKKKYEPPVVKEIGGIYEQATGVSNCTTGSFFGADPCSAGLTPSGTGCTGGLIDQSCLTGGTDGGSCSRGVTV